VTRGTELVIRPASIVHNARRACALAGGAQTYAMVKANAYGHGLIQVANALAAEVDGFGVAVIEEAVALREAGIEAPVMLLEGCFDQGEWRLARQLGLQVVVHSVEQLDTLQAANLNGNVAVWLKLDTGMHRIGLPLPQLDTVLARLAASSTVRVAGLMTHFACADMTEDPLSARQLALIQQCSERHGLPFSAANSAAVFRYPDSHGARVRPGIMLYGSSPFSDQGAEALSLKVTQQLRAPIIAINDVPAGETVGYGASWRAGRDSRIAVVAIGYGDGYPRHAANGAPVYVVGARTVTVGRVSMDMITIDVTDIGEACVGDLVELWGDQVSIDEVARFCGTISYELFCQVTSRPHRVIEDGEA